jgi:hypothetical protein
MIIPTELLPVGSRPPSAQMRPEVSTPRGSRTADAAIDGLAAGFATSTIARHHPERSRGTQSALPMNAAPHNRLVRTTQSRSSRG